VTLRAAGIDDIVAVVGCQAERVRRLCGPSITYVDNVRYAQTNSLYSLWLARPLTLDGFVVMNCDVLLHPRLLVDLMTAKYEDALLLSYADEPLGDEEMKVRVRRGRVVDISKTLGDEDADGENVGVVKFGTAGARTLVACLDARVAAGGLRDWAPRAFGDFARQRPLYAISTRGLPWTEIDFPEDYHRAVHDVLPAIEHDAAPDHPGETTVVVRGIRIPESPTNRMPLSPAAGE